MAPCLAFAPASAQQAISTPILASDQNFRDLAGISASNGGTGFADTTNNNGVLRTGVFYRSEVVNLSDADLATISALHISQDIDLRTPTEIAATPDRVPIGTAYLNVNIYGTQGAAAPTSVNTPAAAVAYFQSLYTGFVTTPVERAAFRTVLVSLANDPDAALYHCSAGKDRTGWTSVLLQTIAGVPPATIMKDYLATNTYTAASIQTQLATIAAQAGRWRRGSLRGRCRRADAGRAAELSAGGTRPGDRLIRVNASLPDPGPGSTSQADIYVLRAKMVDFLTLPGQSWFVGNAAAGAAFLSALQNSPLSGHYTAYNYYLQSAVDAGTLWGVEAQVGGQLHADAASYLLRQPLWIDDAIAPYTSGQGLAIGQTRIWLSGLGGYLASDDRAGAAGSKERSAGPIMGATYRIDERTSANLAIGYNFGSVSSAGANANVGTLLATIGGRYAFSALESGPFVAARADVGGIDYDSSRPLNEGLGTARGSTNGVVYSGTAVLGDVVPLAPFTVTPQAGVRVTHVTLGGFNETGSELALDVNRISHTSSSLLADVDFALDPWQLGDWTIAPAATLGYEMALGSPQAVSTGQLFGFTVSQSSAYNSRYLMRGGLEVTARHDAFAVRAEVNAVYGNGASGINGQLSIAYAF